MADPRAPFPSLESSTGLGEVLRTAVDTVTDPAGINGSIGFAFKNHLDKVVLPKLLPTGEIPVSFDAAGTIKRARGELAAGSATMVDVTGASITLTASLVYVSLGLVVSCRRSAHFQLVQIDDVTTTILYDAIVDAGQYTVNLNLPVDTITAGASGTQTLKLQGMNLQAGSGLSALRGTISVKEIS